MCFGAPGRIVAMGEDHPHLASVDVQGVIRQINIGLIEGHDPQPGDWVDVHLGMALALIDEAQAEEALGFLERLQQDGTS